MQISQHVRARGQRWRVADIRAFDGCEMVTLTALTPPDIGSERVVLTPFDTVEPIAPVGGQQPHRLVRGRRWRRACRSLIAADTPPGRLRTARMARFDLLPHQLEPALAVLRGAGSRVLLADEVGLGKTIQAGLIVAELRARGAVGRLLVITPAGLREQWAHELSARFGIEAPAVDAQSLRRLAASLPVGLNPWTTVPMAVASVDYIKRAEVLPAVAACRWDVVIVDEAHGVAGHSDRHGAVERLASHAAYVVLVTATPHSGDRRSFASLCGLGTVADDGLLVFRRSRSDVGPAARRRVHTIRIRPNAAESHMHALLGRYSDAVRAERHGRWLALSVLHKRALSSAWSLGQSVERRLLAAPADPPIGGQLVLPLGDPDGDRATADEPPAWPDDLGLADAARERRLLTALAAAAHLAAARETKLSALDRLLRRAAESAIVFTEYRDTLLHVRRALSVPTVVLHGGLSRDDRARALDEFTRGPRTVLLATDAAGEGLNLHRACRTVINLELPWNPMRLEQRIGRVDRIGQRRIVHAIHLVSVGTGEERILSRLQERLGRVRDDIGAPGVFGADAEQAVARLVITGDAAEAGEPGICPPLLVGSTVDLSTEAADEARRLTGARALTRERDEEARPEGDGPWVTISRRRETRQHLGGHALLVWRVSCHDECGWLVESRIVPVTMPMSGARRTWRERRGVGLRLRELDAIVRPLVERAVDDWRRALETHVRAFASTRLRREEAMAGDVTADAFQPGLFDRRADRLHDADRAAVTDADRSHAARLAALARVTTLTSPTAQLLLVLVPR